MKKSTITIITLAIALGGASRSNAQIAISSAMNLGVFADANQNDSDPNNEGFHMATYSDAQFGTLNPMSGSLYVRDRDLINTGRQLEVRSSASATWVNAGQGSVAWRGMGWTHDTAASSGAKLNGFVVNGPVWSYTFQATQSGQFLMNYDVRGTGDTFGLLGAKILWSGTGGNLDLINPYDPTALGVFTRDLVAGTSYTVSLENIGNVFHSPFPQFTTSNMDADFNWKISTVPEPSSFLVIGCAVAMTLVRKKRNLGRTLDHKI